MEDHSRYKLEIDLDAHRRRCGIPPKTPEIYLSAQEIYDATQKPAPSAIDLFADELGL